MKRLFLFMITCASLSEADGQVSDSIRTPTGTLHYHLYGKGKPVLLLSGGPGVSAFMVEPVAAGLAKEFQAVLFEQRGTGHSIPVPFDSTTINLKQAMADIHTVKDHLGFKKVSLLGHSYGAYLAVQYGLNYPEAVDKLVLVGLSIDSSFAGDNRTARATVDEREAIRRGSDSVRQGIATAETVARNRKLNFRLAIYDAYKTDSLYDVLKKGGPLNVEMRRLMQQDVAKNGLSKTQIAALKVPTLVVSGRQDPSAVFSTFDISQANKSLLIAWINQSGHYPFVEQRGEFYKVVAPFLRQ